MSVVLLLLGGLTGAPEKAAPSAADCYGCHAEKSFSRKGPGGRKIPLFVNAKQLKKSVHSELSCDSCHAGITAGNHTDGEQRGKTASLYKACRGCHEAGKTVHGRMVSGAGAPRCRTCHGTHGILRVKSTQPGCLSCHGRALSKRLPNGKSLSLRIDEAALDRTSHQKLKCVSCHAGFTNRVHRMIKGVNRIARHRSTDVSCLACHAKVTKLMGEGVHQRLKGDRAQRRPSCSDCHRAHAPHAHVVSGRQSIARCRQCHSKVYDQYAQSVHGAAVLKSGSRDVPACVDCHRAHDIRNPGSKEYRSRIPELCGNCHADRKRMKKYNLSPNVVQSYLDDFHGVTLQFYRKEKRSVRKIAVCVDCHGIHDIQSTRGKNKVAVKKRLLTRCRSCHPKASAAFPDAWVSHWIPSATRTPLVYWINLFYMIIIPLMVFGLGLQVLLHFWRYAVKR